MRSCSYDSLAAHPSEAATKIKHTQIAHYPRPRTLVLSTNLSILGIAVAKLAVSDA
jgi:hypothetical protein